MVDSIEPAGDGDLLGDGILSDGHRVPHTAVEVHLHALAGDAGACALAADIAGDDGKGSDGGCVPFAVVPTLRPKTLGDEAGFVLGDEMCEISDLLGGKPADGGGPLGSLRNVVIAGAHDIVHIGGVCRRRFRHRVGIKSDDILVQEGLVVLLLADNDIGDSARQSPIGARVDGEPLVRIAR